MSGCLLHFCPFFCCAKIPLLHRQHFSRTEKRYMRATAPDAMGPIPSEPTMPRNLLGILMCAGDQSSSCAVFLSQGFPPAVCLRLHHCLHTSWMRSRPLSIRSTLPHRRRSFPVMRWPEVNSSGARGIVDRATWFTAEDRPRAPIYRM